MPTSRPFRRLAAVTLLLALVVVLLGAYVRLSDAGLGCPDWPGCYGRLTVPEATELYPERPLVAHKAWKEMVHRYAAGALGLLGALLFALAWRDDALRWARPGTVALVALIGFQALLGMWTVTLLLHPVVVMGHLLGGLAVTLLLYLLFQGPQAARMTVTAGTGWVARAALAAVLLQIMLGGWTSANYAAPSCPDLPTCQGAWWPEVAFADALRPELRPGGRDYEGGTLHDAARTAIHLSHRIGALVTLLLVGWLSVRLWREGHALRRSALLVGAAVVIQFALGLANVLWQFPLALAVAHNGGAVLLLLATAAANRRLRPLPATARAYAV